MAKDALSRRLRYAPPDPQPDEEQIVPQPADIDQWAALSRHGPLPITYLNAFAKRKNYKAVQRRYTRFYHHGWLLRPPRQYASFHARYAPLVYDLALKAKDAMGDKAALRPASRTAPFVHQLMQACITASFELTAPEHGFRFLSRDDVLGADRDIPVPLGSTKLIPDDLFALQRQDGKKRFFILEVDRNTESIERTNSNYNTWARKITSYETLFKGQLQYQYWSIPKATVLIVTTSTRHAENLRAYIDSNSSDPSRYMIAVEESFGANWRTPKELLGTIEQII